MQRAIGHADGDTHLARALGMLCDVGQAFLDYAIDRGTDLVRSLVQVQVVAMKVGVYPVLFAPLDQVVFERVREPQFVDRSRAQFPRDAMKELPQIVQLLS